ncbi:MAG: LysR family transcriptional regulator [Pseudomonadota bacterium]
MPAHIETHEIRVFRAVFEEGGFKRAADKLFVTQSAVSQTISNLEKKLDSILLERNPLKLTEAGVRLLEYAEVVLGEERNVLADINNIKQGTLSTLLLAISGTVNLLFGNTLVTRFCEFSPLTRLKLSVLPSRQIISAIRSDLWELGFGPFQQQMPPIFDTLPLFTDTRKLVISKHHPHYTSLIRDPEKLAREVPLIVSHLDDPDMRPAIDKLRDSFGTIWEVSDMGLRLNLVAGGQGMSFLDSRVLAQVPVADTLVEIDTLAFASIPLTFGLYYRRKKSLSTGSQKFIELCRGFEF